MVVVQNYVKMCAKASEVQDSWTPPEKVKQGDVFTAEGGLELVAGYAFVPNQIHGGQPKKVMQSANMLETGMQRFTEPVWLPRVCDIFGLFQIREKENVDYYEGTNYLLLLSSFNDFVGDNIPYLKSFETQEEAWLAFFMDHFHSKRWDSEKSEWTER